MRGSAPSWSTVAGWFSVLLLLIVPVTQAQTDWRVTCRPVQICALQGTTVEIICYYTHPTTYKGVTITPQEKFWFSSVDNGVYSRLHEDPVFKNRVVYNCQSERQCTLTITDLRESDSGVYKFRFTTNQADGAYTGEPGVTLSVTAPQIKIHQNLYRLHLICRSSCQLSGPSYKWLKNGEVVSTGYDFYLMEESSEDTYQCAIKNTEIEIFSSLVYPPKLPSVVLRPSGPIVEGSSVNLTCSSDANPAPEYTWYKENQPLSHKEPQLIFSSIQSSDSGRYHCAAENQLWRTESENIYIDVKYPPKLPSVSVSPSGQIVEGSSVTLTCSSDANPAPEYTWYKENQPLSHKEPQLIFSSIQSSDSGRYHCEAENQLWRKESENISIDVEYPPKLLSVSVSPSGQMVEGSSVNLTCSSDSNPAAHYTWYKEDEDSPRASGQIFTITDLRPEHSGNYSCEAQNTRGRQRSALFISTVSGWKSAAMATIPVLVLAVFVLSGFLLIRKKRISMQTSDCGEIPDSSDQFQPSHFEEQGKAHDEGVYLKNQTDPIYSNIGAPGPHGHEEEEDEEDEEEEDVEYTIVKFNSSAPRARGQEPEEEPAVLYSTILTAF